MLAGTSLTVRSAGASLAQRGDGTRSTYDVMVHIEDGAHLDWDVEPLIAAATGVLGLATVVLAHEAAEILVIANGVRAGRRRDNPLSPKIPNADRPAGDPAMAGYEDVPGYRRPETHAHR